MDYWSRLITEQIHIVVSTASHGREDGGRASLLRKQRIPAVDWNGKSAKYAKHYCLTLPNASQLEVAFGKAARQPSHTRQSVDWCNVSHALASKL